MVVPPLEADLFPPVATHFLGGGYAVRSEVDIHGRICDLLACRGEDLVAVELKLRDWRGALRQAEAYQLGAPRSFVALPLDTAMTVLRRRTAYETSGVGLLAVHPPDGSVRELIPARPSGRHLPFLADRLVKTFS